MARYHPAQPALVYGKPPAVDRLIGLSPARQGTFPLRDLRATLVRVAAQAAADKPLLAVSASPVCTWQLAARPAAGRAGDSYAAGPGSKRSIKASSKAAWKRPIGNTDVTTWNEASEHKSGCWRLRPR